MKEKRVRFGFKWIDGQFVEILSMRPHKKTSYISWVPDSMKHVTIIKEPNAISSHSTHNVTGEQTHLGRLFLDDIDLDEELTKLTNLRKMDEEEYDQTLIFKNPEFWDILVKYEYELVTEEREKDILKFMDLSRMWVDIQERIEYLRDNEIMPFDFCVARDLLTRPDIEGGISENELIVFAFEGELHEFDLKPLLQIQSEDHPLAEILKPLGLYELLGDIDLGERLRDQ